MVGMEHEPNHVLITIMLSPVPVWSDGSQPPVGSHRFHPKTRPLRIRQVWQAVQLVRVGVKRRHIFHLI
jgi:hypothetical protein